MQKKEIQIEIDRTLRDLIQLLSSFNHEQINVIPFEGSWTAGQLVRHLVKSNSGFVQLLKGPVKETNRNADEKVERIKSDFLDFSTKTTSADIVSPEDISYEKEELLNSIEHIKKEFSDLIQTSDITMTCLTF